MAIGEVALYALCFWLLLTFGCGSAGYVLFRAVGPQPAGSVKPVGFLDFLRELAARLWAWMLGFGAAIVPNLAELGRGVCGKGPPDGRVCLGDFVGGAYLNTAAGVSLLAFCSCLASAWALWKRSNQPGAWDVGVFTVAFIGVIGISGYQFTITANYFPDGVDMSHFLFLLSVLFTVIIGVFGEAWVAHARLMTR